MNHPSPRELVLLCLPLFLLAGVGFLASRRDPLDARRVSLRLTITAPTNMESLDGADATLSVSLQGSQAKRWKLLTGSPHLQLETASGTIDSRSRGVLWGNTWIRGQTATRTLADLTRVPPGTLHYVCEAYIVPEEHATDTPVLLSQKWPLNRASLKPLWSQKPQAPALSLSKFTITRIEARTRTGKKGRVVKGDLDFGVPKGGGATLDVVPNARPFGITYSVSPAIPAAARTGVTRSSQVFTVEIDNRFPAARRLKTPVRVSGRANTGGCWPLAFQVEPFDFDKVQVGQTFNVKSWPVPRPTP